MTNVTEDEDTKMGDATPEPTEGSRRGKGGRHSTNQGGASMYGKIRHLKKEDGEPLWRKDIQFDFLKAVFDDESKVFTNSYEPDNIGKQNFADLYIDTMSRSSKTSKVLRDKLLSDREAAKGMAMVCLLVNIGRMNTTLNFFPEMRAQLRTYHAIPSLQAHQDPHAYKQLQDAPRLKSILKGGAEDRPEPNTLDKIKDSDIPRTNPVNLLFVICQSAAKIAELHFPPGKEFHDLVMKTNYTSQSRARAFLWVMWFYLESDFTEEGCIENPFGEGVDYGVDVANQGIPKLVDMTEEQEAAENVDPQEEIDFGFAKQKMRAKIIEADQAYMVDNQSKRGSRARVFAAGEEGGATLGILPRIRPSKHESDIDSSRSTPPPRALGRHSGAFGSSSRRGGAPLKYQIFEGSSPGGPAIEGIVARKPRPPTAHQLAVERNRSQRVEYILDRGIRKRHHKSRRLRKVDGAIIRAVKRLKEMADPFDDSESEENSAFNKHQLLLGPPSQFAQLTDSNGKPFPFRERGFGGLVQLGTEEDDFGEEFSAYAAALRRANRRLDRWEQGPDLGVVAPTKKIKPQNGYLNGEKDPNETEEEIDLDQDGDKGDDSLLIPPRPRASKLNGATSSNGDVPMEDADDLNDVDKELLGIADGEDGEDEGDGDLEKDGDDEDEALDDVEKTLLGMDGDSDTE